ncbi:MAG: PAS-domain containing protein [Xanthomonadales bacterium]|nr:PAS-domain containing protein [Xanthomonadales bacterium]
MPGLSTLLLASLAWVTLLFAVALLGERHGERLGRLRPAIYALSLAVYCTAWTFYGTVAQAATHGWPLPPTFLGTILLFLLALPFLRRLVAQAKADNATSLADFVAGRLGKSTGLAALITLIAVLGTVPYLALQLKAVAMSFALLAPPPVLGESPPAWQDVALWVALAMALFAMLFGTRRAAATAHNSGLVVAIAFESLLKLLALLAVGLLAVGHGRLEDLRTLPDFGAGDGFLALVLLGALVIFTLPHQFHVAAVECRDPRHLGLARWLFPAYLLAIALPVPLLAAAGLATFGERLPADLYVLALPLAEGRPGLALLAFLGGLSAATGMVILASLALSIMIGNHWLAPLALERRLGARGDLRGLVLLERRAAIATVLLAAYLYSRALGASEALADLGALAFSAFAQLAPAVLVAVYRPAFPARAVGAGILAGVLTWAYVLFMPTALGPRAELEALPAWLTPQGFLGLDGLERLSRAVLSSLTVNLAVTAVAARLARRRPRPHRPTLPAPELRALAERFLDRDSSARLFAGGQPPAEAEIEHALAAVLGQTSARLLLDAAARRLPAPLEAVAEIVGEATEQARFSQALLATALENMSQGISVVDRDFRLVAWNRRYAELFRYPPALLAAGTPVAALIRHNLEAGLLGPVDVERELAKRLAHMRAGSPYVSERRFPGGAIIEIRGNPMPGGGYVATFTEVTAFRRAEEALRQTLDTLEQRVAERTREAESARLAAEQANAEKSRFLAAVSHDLVQPLNAAQLFAEALEAQLGEPADRALLGQLRRALAAVDTLLASLLEIARLEGGALRPRRAVFPVAETLDALAAEARALAAERGLELRYRPSTAWVESDPALLRRIVQNFLANALRYTQRGGVLLAARRRGAALAIEVWDTGPGIPEALRERIFEPFRRGPAAPSGPGLGLGLAIAERLAALLGHRLRFRSRVGRGTVFAVELPLASPAPRPAEEALAPPPLAGLRVLVADDDPALGEGLLSLLAAWGVEAALARSLGEGRARLAAGEFDLALLDVHLGAPFAGLELAGEARGRLRVAMMSADQSAALAERCRALELPLLAKPVRALKLHALLSGLRPPQPPGGASASRW